MDIDLDVLVGLLGIACVVGFLAPEFRAPTSRIMTLLAAALGALVVVLVVLRG